MAKRTGKQKKPKKVRTTLSLSQQTVDYLKGLAEIGFRGNYYTEIATVLLEQVVDDLAARDVIAKKKKSLEDARALIKEGQKN
jgi:hypothetical protein